MVLLVNPGDKAKRGYLYMPNGSVIRLMNIPGKGVWVVARDIYRTLELDESNFLKTIAEVDPSRRGAVHPHVGNTKTWVNLVTVGGMLDLLELELDEELRRGDKTLGDFYANFMDAYGSRRTMWEQALFEEGDHGSDCAAGE